MTDISIEITKTVRKSPLADKKIIHLAKTVLRSEKIKHAEVSIAVIGDKTIENLTEEFSGKRYCTDVISFDLTEQEDEKLSAQIAVNSQLARRKAAKFKISPASELGLYIVHGLLHLLGYDDHNPDDALKMHRRSLTLLKKSGFKKLPPTPEF